MKIELLALPYPMDGLQPHLSKETLEYHYGKHYKGYVDRLNAALPGTTYEGMPLDEIVLASVGHPLLFSVAAQAWNHAFYWNGLSSHGGGEPRGAMEEALKKAFGGYSQFVKKFSDVAAGHFGSGWAWLVRKGDSSLDVVATHDADTPMTARQKPLLTCDVWEHAYYIDYRNARPKYIEAFWRLVNWELVEKNLRG